jgi:hypothetical protein
MMSRNVLGLGLLLLAGSFTIGCGGDDACDAGTFPSAPSGAKDILYVSAACPASGADGTKDHPFATIAAAIESSSSGGAILVAVGTYKENLVIDHDLSITGESSKGKKGDDAAIILQSPAPDAIKATKGTVMLAGFHVIDASGVGIFAEGGSVTVLESKVEGTKTANGTAYGVAAIDDGAIILQDSAVVGSASLGAYVSGAAARFTGTDFTDNAGGAIRLETAKGDVHVDSCILQDNGLFGVAAFSSGAIILQSQIRGTKGNADAELGDGIVAGFLAGSTVAATVNAKGNTIAENDQVGLLMSGGTHGIILQDNMVTDNGKGAGFGGGVWLQGGTASDGASSISNNHVEGNTFLGIGLSDETNAIKLDTNIVTGTKLGSWFHGGTEHKIGDGLTLVNGASTYAVSNQFSSSGRQGVILDGENGSLTTLTKNRIEHNDEYGIILQNQADMPTIKGDNTITGNAMGAEANLPSGKTADVVTIPFATP